MGDQLVLPATHDMHESKKLKLFLPPHTTSLPLDSRERLWAHLRWGRSGIEQVEEKGRGNNSTEDRKVISPLLPPTITWPFANNHKKSNTWNIVRMINRLTHKITQNANFANQRSCLPIFKWLVRGCIFAGQNFWLLFDIWNLIHISYF